MFDKAEKPMLDVDQQIQHLSKKGVTFKLISEEEAKEYLKRNNNYFKLRAYRKNFPKHPGGENKGKYINLDFAMLKDLAIIDMRLRYIIIHMTLDIEHYAKIKLIRAIENTENDGYQIVSDYIQSLKDIEDANPDKNFHQKLMNELNRNKDNPYCGGLLSTYHDSYPIWAFVEIISFGSLLSLYKFCANKLDDKDLLEIHHLLLPIKQLRNAAAHNTCLIYDMRPKKDVRELNRMVARAIPSSIASRHMRKQRTRNEVMRELLTLLFLHTNLVTSRGIHDVRVDDLEQLVNRMNYHIDYYNDNDVITENFKFIGAVIDVFFKKR